MIDINNPCLSYWISVSSRGTNTVSNNEKVFENTVSNQGAHKSKNIRSDRNLWVTLNARVHLECKRSIKCVYKVMATFKNVGGDITGKCFYVWLTSTFSTIVSVTIQLFG